MANWNGLDFFIFLIFFVNTLLGMSRGATKEIISMMCLSAGLIFTIKFTVPLTIFLNSSPLIKNVLETSIAQNFITAIGGSTLTIDSFSELSYCIAVLTCFVSVFCVSEVTLNYAGFSESFTFPYATLNRKVGAALGATRGFIIALIFILVCLHLFKNNKSTDSMISGSYFVKLFQNTSLKLDSLISRQEVGRYNELYQDKNLFNEKDVYKIIPDQPQ